MKNVDIEKLEELKDILEELDENDVSFIEKDGAAKYVVMPITYFDYLESFKEILDEDGLNKNGIKIVSNSIDLTYDEYEDIKKKLNEEFDKNFKPKAEKLN